MQISLLKDFICPISYSTCNRRETWTIGLIYSQERLGRSFEKRVLRLAALDTEDVLWLKGSSLEISSYAISPV